MASSQTLKEKLGAEAYNQKAEKAWKVMYMI